MACFDTLRAGAPGFSLFKSWGEGGLVIQKERRRCIKKVLLSHSIL